MTPHSTQDYQAVRLHNTGLNMADRDASTSSAAKPTIVGIWRLVQRLHRGTWCDIYYAQPADASGSPRFDYAVKIVRPDCLDLSEAMRQIRAEVEVTRVAKHPHLIPVLDSDLQGTRPFIVMPRMETKTLTAAIQRNPARPSQQPIPVSLWWVRQAAQALRAVHDSGWVHGDLTPNNLLVDPRGHVTLIDLGFAQPVGAAIDQKFRGTPEYAAPEQLAGVPANPAADVCSLGKVLAKLLPQDSDVPAPVKALLNSMLATEPESRPNTKALCEQLLRLEIETLHLHISPGDLFPKKAA